METIREVTGISSTKNQHKKNFSRTIFNSYQPNNYPEARLMNPAHMKTKQDNPRISVNDLNLEKFVSVKKVKERIKKKNLKKIVVNKNNVKSNKKLRKKRTRKKSFRYYQNQENSYFNNKQRRKNLLSNPYLKKVKKRKNQSLKFSQIKTPIKLAKSDQTQKKNK